MALVVFLRGVNVGGYRVFRPAELARQLRSLEAINIGAAGTLVIRKPAPRGEVRQAIARRLPFPAEIVVCTAREINRLMARDDFAGQAARPDIVRFASVLCRTPRAAPSLPLAVPSRGRWMVQILARDGRFVIGQYRREMKVLSHLGSLDRLWGVPLTTRNWNTLQRISQVLNDGGR